MTQKEKAKELVDKMHKCLFSDGLYDSKQCALIAVYEIELALTEYGEDSDALQNMDNEFRWWDGVKKEIENYES